MRKKRNCEMDGEERMISFEFEIWIGVIDVYRDAGMSIYRNYMENMFLLLKGWELERNVICDICKMYYR